MGHGIHTTKILQIQAVQIKRKDAKKYYHQGCSQPMKCIGIIEKMLNFVSANVTGLNDSRATAGE